ncbi:Eco57I restriction-modification methylase domain-containing protein [Chelonobacter oris]|uniref:Eco57I restriction-modification methylase domain-containing protein n=1 Tax=Chelonobacter oris TaxID=505317 RepID=UPI000B1D31AE|nr:Eco57I restriction-modification methylase domain-containing protein [Chelonobacter oris]
MAESINYNPDVLNCLANLSNDEVFTPPEPELANRMLDLLPPSLWQDPNATFLDPACKSGVFLREIAKRLIEGLKPHFPDLQVRLNHIFRHQLYGIAITEMTGLLARRSVYCAKRADGEYSLCTEFEDEQGNIVYTPAEHHWQNGKCKTCGATENVYLRENHFENHAYGFIHHNTTPKLATIKHMKFDVIITNPPYQLSDGGAQASASPIYHKFVEQAKKLNPRYLVMITPSRWFAGGKGLDTFRANMLADKRIKEIHDYPNAADCFPGVVIEGGVNYFLWQKDYCGDCLVSTYENHQCVSQMRRPIKEKGVDIFIRQNEGVAVLHKIKKLNEKSFSSIVSSQKPFGFRTFFKGKPNPFSESVKIFANRNVGYVARAAISRNPSWIDQHKVIVPYAVGSGDSKTDLVKPIYSEPNSCCSETYLVIGPFSDQKTCMNVISYIKTKFFHFMLGLKKNTQHTTQKVYQFVPMQDFSKAWTDAELYKNMV